MLSAKKELFTPSGGNYQISRSVRLRSSASAYFNRSFTTPTSQQKGTFSFWLKRGVLGARNNLFSNDNGTQYGFFEFDANNKLNFADPYSAGACSLITTQVFRDPSAWYHIIIAFDTTQATSTNRAKFYVNGVQITSFDTATYPSQNANLYVLQAASAVQIAAFTRNGTPTLDGYLTEYNFIDGQALTPSSFGETNSVTGVWQPKKYGGTYGTNGFYLNFSDNSAATATTIGKDYSGNGNNWTPNNISITAGTTYDSMIDVPTPYADGGNGRGNYCTWSPLGTQIATYTTSITNGNLTASYNAATNVARINGTLGISSGKWYFEFQATAGSPMIGFATTDGANAYVYDGNAANKRNYAPITSGSPTSAAYGATWNTTNVIGVALDLDAGTLVFYKDNVSQGTAYSSLSGTFTPIFGFQGGTTVTGVGNFGQRPFTYTPPTGFVALNTQNLPTPTISNGASYMAATTYTGDGATTKTIATAVNGVSFQPDFTWVKRRSGASSHVLQDAIRGFVGTAKLASNATDAENNTGGATGSAEGFVSAVSSTGFTVTKGTGEQVNENGATYVGWQWNAGGSTVTNTSGSISAQVRANATAGFSVVTYTGTGANATVGHGLGVAPRMVIIKQRNSAADWVVKHASLSSNDATLILNNTSASTVYSPSVWNNTAPTSTVFSIGTNTANNTNTNTYVAYCFAAVAGYSAFGKYTGNGSAADGVFVYLGFRARFLMIKRTDGLGGWVMLDTARDTYNDVDNYLYANSSAADAGSSNVLDINSNGFKIRNSWTDINASGGTYVYMAFCENPFKISLAR